MDCIMAFAHSRKRESESARSRKHGITEATDIPLTIPLSTTEKKQSAPSKTVHDGGGSKTSVLGCSEVIFRDAENVGRAAIAPENLAPPRRVEAIRSRWSQIVKNQIEKSKKCKKYGKE